MTGYVDPKMMSDEALGESLLAEAIRILLKHPYDEHHEWKEKLGRVCTMEIH